MPRNKETVNRALYYPFIEIPDDGMLNSMALFWDEIATITPDTDQPYQRSTSQEYMDAGVIVPYRANPDRREIRDIAEDIADLMGNPHIDSLIGEEHWSLRQSRDYPVHPDKLASNLQYELEKSGFGQTNEEGFVEMRDGLAALYMLLLSMKVSGAQKSSMVTDQLGAYKASNVTRIRESFTPLDDFPFHHRHHRHERLSREFVDACIHEMSLSWFRIAPEASPKSILKYRKKYGDELTRMKSAILKANSNIFTDEAITLGDLRVQASNYVHDEIQPAYDDLCRTLTESGIKFLPDLLEAALYSEGVGVLATTVGQSWALVAAPACGMAIRSVKHLADQRSILQNSPWSYLYHLEKKVGTED